MKKLLVYNMPERELNGLNGLKDKYEYEIIIADMDNLGHKISDIIDGTHGEPVNHERLEHVDINFLMIHGFDKSELGAFVNELNSNDIKLPNKCISTPINLDWVLYDLLLENQEEALLMPIITNLFKLRTAMTKLHESGNGSKELEDEINYLNEYIARRDYEYDELREIFNKAAKIYNNHIEN